MKTQLIFFSFILLISFSSCDKATPVTTLAGKWRLTHTLADPGDGSGRWMQAKSETYLILHQDGTLSGDQGTQYKSYTIIDDSKIEFTLHNNAKTTSFYKIVSGSLELMHSCIEACGSRYIKAN